VWDTGVGIATEELGRLFRPFVQVDSGLARHYEGSGLGLALVARLTEMHGGSVAVESEPGQGSRFTVSLPWQRNKADTLAGLTTCPWSGTKDNSSIAESYRPPDSLRRAVIIEDSPSAAQQLHRYLEAIGVDVAVLDRGEQAPDHIRTRPPDLIILDILLPDTSGWNVLATLKQDPHIAHIPVIITSVIDEQSQGHALGAVGYLVKPVSRHRLYALLQRLFPMSPVSPKHEPEHKPEHEPEREQEGTAAHVAPPPPEQATLAAEASATPTPSPPRPRILLAEDNEENSVMLADYLNTRGYQVEIAKNGSEAVESARGKAPDLILMDIQMPVMDGLEAIRRIRTEAHLARVPIIALTALAMPGDRERCLAAGADDYMSKPISLKKLASAIETYGERKPFYVE
jgi:CheY-like chemotaxis protein